MTQELNQLLQEFHEKLQLHLDETEDFDSDYRPTNRVKYVISQVLEEEPTDD